MTDVTRRLVPFVLLVLGIIGFVLVVTADEGGLAFQRVVTADGVEVDIPDGWEPIDDRPFEYRPPSEVVPSPDRWLVAWACGPDGCAARSLVEWMEMGERLPTFVGARADEGELLFDIEETSDESSRVLRATTAAGGVRVVVAVFQAGSDHYLECGLSVFDDSEGLGEAIVDACRGAVPPTP